MTKAKASKRFASARSIPYPHWVTNTLADIIAHKETEWKRLVPHAKELREKALERDDFRPFRASLHRGDQLSLIAEVKKASPSAGVIAPNFDPLSQAREYARAGAQALSVLTDEKFFQGHLSHLHTIRKEVDLPVLRKDFIVHELQIYESIIAGADAILLIVAALPSDDQLEALYERAHACQLDVLVEVHNLEEMNRALDLGADLIGINNRNLKTFVVDLATTEELAEEIPSDCIAVSESGIRTGADAKRMRAAGINALLVGEALMRTADIKGKVAELLLDEDQA